MQSSSLQGRPRVLVALAAALVAIGAAIGASTNAVSGAVSPLYFRTVLRWDGVEDVWRAALAQGILEGLIFGVVLSAIFTVVVGVVSGARAPATLLLRYVLWMVVGVYACWALGGLIAMGLATLSPEFYRHTFVGVPDEAGPMLRYAWVGGSIWGVQIGGVLTVILGGVLFPVGWKRFVRGAAAESAAG